MTCDGDMGWNETVYGDGIDDSPRWPDMDAPHPFPDGNSASGFGTSSTSKFTGVHTDQTTGAARYIERPGSRTGLSGQPVTPRYPTT